MGAFQLANAQGTLDALEAFEPAYRHEEKDLTEKIVARKKFMVAAGFEIHPKPDKPLLTQKVVWGGVKESLRDKATEASRLYTPKIHYNWVLTSGATHCRLWYTNGVHGEWDTIVVGTVSPLLDIADLLVDRVLGYVGFDGQKLHENTHRRRLKLLNRVVAGDSQSSYDEYRRA